MARNSLHTIRNSRYFSFQLLTIQSMSLATCRPFGTHKDSNVRNRGRESARLSKWNARSRIDWKTRSEERRLLEMFENTKFKNSLFLNKGIERKHYGVIKTRRRCPTRDWNTRVVPPWIPRFRSRCSWLAFLMEHGYNQSVYPVSIEAAEWNQTAPNQIHKVEIPQLMDPLRHYRSLDTISVVSELCQPSCAFTNEIRHQLILFLQWKLARKTHRDIVRK